MKHLNKKYGTDLKELEWSTESTKITELKTRPENESSWYRLKNTIIYAIIFTDITFSREKK